MRMWPLHLYTVICTGYGELRGLMLYEEVAPLSFMLQEDFNADKIDRGQFVDGLR